MSTDDARGVERELLAEALHERLCTDDFTRGEPSCGICEDDAAALLASPQFARLIAAARAEGRREVREAVEGVLREGPDTWTPYDSRDTGETFLAESVTDFTADLRAALAAETPTESAEEAR